MAILSLFPSIFTDGIPESRVYEDFSSIPSIGASKDGIPGFRVYEDFSSKQVALAKLLLF